MRDRLERAARLLERAAAAPRAPTLDGDDDLRREAARLLPHVEALVGRPYGRLPDVRYRRGLGARLVGPWSQYLTLGHPATRRIRMSPLPAVRPAVPTVLAHELAHRYSFDESITTLRGLEVSARLAEDGDPLHARGAPRELARLLLGAAMGEARATGTADEIERFLRERPGDPALARSRAQWARLAGRRRPVDCATCVYAQLPCQALERAAGEGRSATDALPHPRFPIDSLHAGVVALYTAADALSGRRRDGVPIEAALRLWRSAAA